jgi:hypothetical protein
VDLAKKSFEKICCADSFIQGIKPFSLIDNHLSHLILVREQTTVSVVNIKTKKRTEISNVPLYSERDSSKNSIEFLGPPVDGRISFVTFGLQSEFLRFTIEQELIRELASLDDQD